MARKRNGKRESKRQDRRNGWVVYALLLTVAFSFRVAVARFYANDSPDDGKIYAQIARNLLEQHVYSHETKPPYVPSLIRLPGYPLFLAGVYSVFGHGDNTAVRIVQAAIDTASCALIALVAYFWEPDEKRKRRTSIAALALAAVCPFTTIYVATILTETLTIFFAVAMCLTATLALRATRPRDALWLWVATGLISGIAVLFRPDSGLFALAIGITLVVSLLGRAGDVKLDTKREELLYRSARASYLGAVFSLAFCLVLVPWTVRNYRVFHLFQPLAPAHAEMPGEFVPRGYLAWLRTWLDDSRYIGPVLWALDTSPIKLTDIPDNAFDSAEEKQRVAVLLEKYNHPSEESELFTSEPDSQAAETPATDQSTEKQSEVGEPTNEASPSDEADQNDNTDEGDESDEDNTGDEADEKSPPSDQAVEMTPEIDAGFASIAQERIARNRIRYYLWLPLKRAHSLWFDTHSQYYPFEGELLPLDDLDYDIHQQYWLPLFAGLTLCCTVLGIAGGWFLCQGRDFISQQWVLLATLMVFLRLGFFATLENPEPRYVVEVFPFLSILGAIAVVRIGALMKNKTKGSYRNSTAKKY
jgi:uncharacterized membrane protein HdeD (DUF308 family)